MKFQHLLVLVSIGTAAINSQANAQIRTQPAPTGQVPTAYPGQQGNSNAGVQPKPTGQIAPEAPGSLGTIQQPASTVQAPKAAPVQDLGFEVHSRPVTQQGMVPKLNTNQDPRTMQERYQPVNANSTQTITTERVTERSETPVGNTAPGAQTSGNPQTAQERTSTGQATPSPAKAQTGAATPQAQQYQNTTPATNRRVEPKQ